MNWLLSYLESLSFQNRVLLKRVFLSLIEFPIISGIYHYMYCAVIKRKISQGLLTTLDIETYNVCNLRCIMCSYPDMTREKVLMSMDLFKKIIDDAAINNIRQISLSFYNEPLLDPLLFERIKYAKSKGLWVAFSSNGCLLTSEKINAILDSGLDSIRFSFDGAVKETYEKIRVGANFEKTKSNIIQLIKERNKRGTKNPSVAVGLVIQKDNYQEISKFRSFWKEVTDEVRVWTVDARKIEGLLSKELEIRKSKYNYPCSRIFNVMTVTSNGKVALCCLDYDGLNVLGDLNESTIDEVRNSEKVNIIKGLHLSGQGSKIKLCRDTNCIGSMERVYEWWWIQ